MIIILSIIVILIPIIYEQYDKHVLYPKRKIEHYKRNKELGLDDEYNKI